MVSILGGWYWGEGIKTQAENTETQNNPKIPQSRRKLAWCQIQVLHSEKIPSIDILYIYTVYHCNSDAPWVLKPASWIMLIQYGSFDMFWHLNPALPLLCFHTFNFLHIFTFLSHESWIMANFHCPLLKTSSLQVWTLLIWECHLVERPEGASMWPAEAIDWFIVHDT